MEAGASTSHGKISPRLLDLNSEWAVEEDRGIFCALEERKLELKLGLPNEEEKRFFNGNNRKNVFKSPSSNSTVNKTPISLLLTSTLTSTTTTNNTSYYNYKKKQKSSQYRGVTRDVRKGIYKAQIWDGSCKEEGIRKGKQVYLGKYAEEDAAAMAYDLAALKYFGPAARINFPLANYEKEIKKMENMEKEEYLAILKRNIIGLSRSVSTYKGVRKAGEGWQAVMKSVANKRPHLGTFGTADLFLKGLSRGARAERSAPHENSSLPVAAIENESVVLPNLELSL